MSRVILALLTLVFLGCQGSSVPVSPAVNGLDAEEFFQKDHSNLIFEKLNLFPNQTEFSIAIIRNNDPRFFGIIRRNDTLSATINHQSVFEIGSISKVFTSTLLADFVQEGKLNLDDNINNYLDFKLNKGTQLTFTELSNHTSGLPRMPSNNMLGAILNYSNPFKNYDEEKLISYLTEDLELKFEKGKKSNYSNLGAGLLGYTLSKYSGKDYETLLKEGIFSRYQMNQSTIKRDKIKDQLVLGLDKDGNETSNWDLGALIPAGGILSSTNDLTKFAFAHFDSTNQELQLTREITFQDSTSMDLGLAWHIISTESDNKWHWHNGGTGGYTSSMVLDTKNNNAVIILSNMSFSFKYSRNIDDLAFALMRSLNED